MNGVPSCAMPHSKTVSRMHAYCAAQKRCRVASLSASSRVTAARSVPSTLRSATSSWRHASRCSLRRHPQPRRGSFLRVQATDTDGASSRCPPSPSLPSRLAARALPCPSALPPLTPCRGSAVDLDLIELEIKVEGMMCDGCVSRIQAALEVSVCLPLLRLAISVASCPHACPGLQRAAALDLSFCHVLTAAFPFFPGSPPLRLPYCRHIVAIHCAAI